MVTFHTASLDAALWGPVASQSLFPLPLAGSGGRGLPGLGRPYARFWWAHLLSWQRITLPHFCLHTPHQRTRDSWTWTLTLVFLTIHSWFSTISTALSGFLADRKGLPKLWSQRIYTNMAVTSGQVWAIFPPFETEDGIREILTVEEIRDSLLHRIRIKNK